MFVNTCLCACWRSCGSVYNYVCACVYVYACVREWAYAISFTGACRMNTCVCTCIPTRKCNLHMRTWCSVSIMHIDICAYGIHTYAHKSIPWCGEQALVLLSQSPFRQIQPFFGGLQEAKLLLPYTKIRLIQYMGGTWLPSSRGI